MTATPPAVLDTDMLSEVMRDRDPHVLDSAKHYLAEHGCFTFSIITPYEILRGLKAREATRQVALFERQCAKSIVLPFGLFCDGNHVEDGVSVLPFGKHTRKTVQTRGGMMMASVMCNLRKAVHQLGRGL